MSTPQQPNLEITEGRVPVESMTEQEMLREILTHMRDVEDALASLAESPMIGALMSGQNPLTAMMGR